MNITQEAKNIEDYIIKCRQDLHQMPEVGINLEKTSTYVKSRLDELQIPYKQLKNCSGIVGIIGNKEGKVIGLRADMDALPIKEEADVSFKSKNNNMHACGHDTHTAMLLGAAKILKENEDSLNGQVKLLFQPAEEQGMGAKLMVDEGALENPKVDFIIGQHIGAFEGINPGTMFIKSNNFLASADSFYIKIIGSGGHGSTPELTVDPIYISTQVINSIYGVISREIGATDSVTISICNVKSEQQEIPAYNIIPNYVEIMGTVRCSKNSNRDFIKERMERIIKNTTEEFNGSYEFEYIKQFPALNNDPKMTEFIINSASEVVGKENIIKLDSGMMGSEDISYFFEKVPGVFWGLNANIEEEKIYCAHHPKFKINENVLYKGSAILAQSAIDYLND